MQPKESIGSVEIIYGMSLVGDILLQNQLFICSALHNMITVVYTPSETIQEAFYLPQKIKAASIITITTMFRQTTTTILLLEFNSLQENLC